MIIKCVSEKDLRKLLEYIGNNYMEAIYLYLDAHKYGTSNPDVSSWIQVNGKVITSAVLTYHSGMHIYSKDKSFNVSELAEFINLQKPNIVCAQRIIISRLSDMLTQYNIEIGNVAKFIDYNQTCNAYPIRKATKNDYLEMARMMMAEDIGVSYSLKDLVAEIEERINDGCSRSYCMFDGDKLVAQASTGAEAEGVATIAYVVTDPLYRNRGLAKSIVTYLSNELKNEGFEVFLVYYSSIAGKLYLNHGFKNVCQYGKLYRKIEYSAEIEPGSVKITGR